MTTPGSEPAPSASPEGSPNAAALPAEVPLLGGVRGGLPPRFTGRNPLRWPWLVGGVALLGLLAALFWFNPAHHGFYPQCVFYRVTGLSCPGCGGLRAAHQLLHGEVAAAFRFNPFVVLALPVVGWLIGRRWLGRPPLSHRAVLGWAWAAVVALLVFAVVRNLPSEIIPFFRFNS